MIGKGIEQRFGIRRRFATLFRVSAPRGAKPAPPADRVDPGARVRDRRVPPLFQAGLPFAQLPRKSDRDPAAPPARRDDRHLLAVAHVEIVFAQPSIERLVLEEGLGRHPADVPIGGRGHRQAGAEVLVMTRPRIGRVGVEHVLEAGPQPLVERVAAGKRQEACRQHDVVAVDDATADRIRAGVDLAQDGCKPVARDPRVAVGAGDDTGDAG